MRAWRTRTYAAAIAVAFTLGTIVVPALHLAFHALPHDHDGGEIHYHFAPHDEDHDEDHDHEQAAEAQDHDHDDDHDVDHHHDSDHDREPFDPHHGDGSAAHFSLALGEAAATTIELALSGAVTRERIVAPQCGFHVSAHVSVLRFRGPPAFC